MLKFAKLSEDAPTAAIPAVKEDEKPQDAAPRKRHTFDDGVLMRVLVVDDNVDSAKTMGWMMEMFGNQVHLAYTGPEALKEAQEFKPHLVLMDIGLPGINGYEVCQTMRRMPELEDAVIVAQTGWGEREHKEMSKEAGFDHYLVKPVEMGALKQLVDTIRDAQ
ncbi:MAG: response regulator [Micavibrio sp.]|nr:response regulator [Micavibrio sp.]